VPPRPGITWKRVANALRSLGRSTRPDGGRRGAWVWGLPIGGFVVCVAILVVAGVWSGVWAAEYIPIALLEGLVIAGLFLVCFAKDPEPPENDHGDDGPGHDPASTPPPFDPTVWLPLFPDGEGRSPTDRDAARGTRRAPVGARR
jgi:hypothetical protein